MHALGHCSLSASFRLLLMFYCLFSAQFTLAQDNLSSTTTPFFHDWFASESDEVLRETALSFIAQAADHGLDPHDYHYEQLSALDPQHLPSQQRFNTLLNQGLRELVHDLRIGRWSIDIVDPDWHIEQDIIDPDALLRDALVSGNFNEQLNNIAPTHDTYRQLQLALQRYQHYAKQGGWDNIPPTPTLHVGDVHPHIAYIQQRLAIEDPFFALTHAIPSTHYDPLMAQAIRRFQHRHQLTIDGVIGAKTIRALNISVDDKIAQLRINLERYRWLPRQLDDRFIWINLPQYRLQAFEEERESLSMNVVIGKPNRQTPSFYAEMARMVFNPYWYVPNKLARLDLVPKQQHDPNYFLLNAIRVFEVNNGEKSELDPMFIDWEDYSAHRPFPYLLRQDPGRRNALGQIKFLFDNPWQIYLHDSPSKSLFNDPNRAYSSGCIRVADPVQLANFSLEEHPAYGSVTERIDSEENQGLVLQKKLAIFVVYFTVSVDDNGILFLPDVYHRDQRMVKNLY